jgi:hypothetical protein
MKGMFAVCAALAASLVSVPAYAELTSFANYSQQDIAASSLTFRNSAGAANSGTAGTLGTSTTKTNLGSGVEVFLNFLPTGLTTAQADQIKNLSATYKLTASTAVAATPLGSFIDQSAINGTLSFIYDGPNITLTGSNITGGSFTIASGANLLSAVFTGADIFGKTNSSSPTASDSTMAGGTVTYTSDLYNFTTTTADFSLGFSALKSFGTGTAAASGLGAQAGKALRSFTASSTGIFSADPAPKFSFVTASTPEPGTWAIMIVGFGVVGAVARSRKFGATLNFA